MKGDFLYEQFKLTFCIQSFTILSDETGIATTHQAEVFVRLQEG